MLICILPVLKFAVKFFVNGDKLFTAIWIEAKALRVQEVRFSLQGLMLLMS